MARVPYLQSSDLGPDEQDLLTRPIALARALVNSPQAARAFFGVGQFIRYGSKLDPRLRELAILQVGWLARSPYEWSHHVKIGHDFGVTGDDIRAMIEESGGTSTALDTLTRTVLRGAREMTTEGGMSDATFTALRDALGHEQVVDLTLTIGFYNAVVRVLATLAIDVEAEYEPYLRQFPLPS